MKNDKSKVQVDVGVNVDRKLEKKLETIDRKLTRSRKKQELAQKRQARQLGGLVAAQKAESTATVQTARALEMVSRDMNRLTSDMRRYNSEVDKATRKNNRFMRSLGKVSKQGIKGAAGLSKGLLKGGLVGLGLGAAAGLSGAMMTGPAYAAHTQRRFTRMGVASDASENQMSALRARIFSTAKRKDIAISPEELMAAVSQILEKTGDLSLAEGNLETMAQAISASGAMGSDIGSMVADLSGKMMLETSKELKRSMDTFILQGKAGAFTLSNSAAQGDRLFSAYSGVGRTGEDAVRELGAIIQSAKQGTGSAEQAVTAVEAIIRDFSGNSELMSDYGIDVFDPNFDPGTKLRSLPDLIREFISATEGDTTLMREVVGDEAIRLINVLNNAKGLANLEKYLSIRGTGDTLARDSARVASDALGAIEVSRTEFKESAATNLEGLTDEMASSLRDISTGVNDLVELAKEKRQPILDWMFGEGGAIADPFTRSPSNLDD